MQDSTPLTQERYQLITNEVINYNDDDWDFLVLIAESRLASFLCLEDFPEITEDNQDLLILLANFISATMKFAGTDDMVTSKHVRNFTINFKTNATNAFSQIYGQYRDIIEKYSQCGTHIKVERSNCRCYRGFVNF